MLRRLCLLDVLDVLGVPELMRCVVLCMLEGVEGGLCALETSDRRRTGRTGGDALCGLYMSEAVEGEVCLLEVRESMRCMVEADRGWALLAGHVGRVGRVRRVRRAGHAGRTGGDALCATLYAGGCRG